MTAVVMMSRVPDVLAMILGTGITLALAVLVAHWGAYRPAKSTRRIVSAVLLAVALSGTVVLAEDFVISCAGSCWIIECWFICFSF